MNFGLAIFVGAIFVLPFLAFIVLSLSTALYWSKGKIPPYYTETQEHIAEMQVALVVNLLKASSDRVNDKLRYFSVHFFYYFPDYDELNLAVHNFKTEPIRTTEASKWLNKALSDEHKMRLLHVLADVSMIDEVLEKLEFKILSEIALQFGIEQYKLEQIIQEIKDKQQAEKKIPASNRDREIQKALTIFGLEQPFDAVRLKRRYFKLVKMVHPDQFPNATALEKEKLSQQFQELQSAYELLNQMIS